MKIQELMKNMYTTYKKPIRFLVSGGFAAIAEYVSFAVLNYYFNDHLILINVISFVIGLIISFNLNKWWVFDSKNAVAGEFVKYLALACINLVLGSLILFIFVDKLIINPLIAKFLVMALIAIWNYFIFSKIIFGQK